VVYRTVPITSSDSGQFHRQPLKGYIFIAQLVDTISVNYPLQVDRSWQDRDEKCKIKR